MGGGIFYVTISQKYIPLQHGIRAGRAMWAHPTFTVCEFIEPA